jgi:hypothetical protein
VLKKHQLAGQASLDYHHWAVPWTDMNLEPFGVLDVHLWFVQNVDLVQNTKYIEAFKLENDLLFPECQATLMQYWKDHRDELIQWMDTEMALVARVGRQHGIPYGNTEGWGSVCWMDHPALNWDFIKTSAEICAQLGARHGYSFNCTSNFTHPHFEGLWKDIKWHQRVTNIIRQG